MVGNFRKNPLIMVLRGEEWFALLARVAGKPLSDEGAELAREAVRKLGKQMLAASELNKETGK